MKLFFLFLFYRQMSWGSEIGRCSDWMRWIANTHLPYDVLKGWNLRLATQHFTFLLMCYYYYYNQTISQHHGAWLISCLNFISWFRFVLKFKLTFTIFLSESQIYLVWAALKTTRSYTIKQHFAIFCLAHIEIPHHIKMCVCVIIFRVAWHGIWCSYSSIEFVAL